MRRAVTACAGLLAVVALGAGGYRAFRHSGHDDLARRSTQACHGQEEPSKSAPAALPLALPAHKGATLLRVSSKDGTVLAVTKVAGGPSAVVATRDAVLAELTASGYTATGADQEPGQRADAQVGGVHTGSIKVTALCRGLLEVTYRIKQ